MTAKTQISLPQTLAVLLIGAASLLATPAVAASAMAQTRQANVRPMPPASACLDTSHLASHAAYIPTASDNVARCGQLLSTDTLLTVRHWGQT